MLLVKMLGPPCGPLQHVAQPSAHVHHSLKLVSIEEFRRDTREVSLPQQDEVSGHLFLEKAVVDTLVENPVKGFDQMDTTNGKAGIDYSKVR